MFAERPSKSANKTSKLSFFAMIGALITTDQLTKCARGSQACAVALLPLSYQSFVDALTFSYAFIMDQSVSKQCFGRYLLDKPRHVFSRCVNRQF